MKSFDAEAVKDPSRLSVAQGSALRVVDARTAPAQASAPCPGAARRRTRQGNASKGDEAPIFSGRQWSVDDELHHCRALLFVLYNAGYAGGNLLQELIADSIDVRDVLGIFR